MDRLFLIDGHALIFKMYYAFLGRPMMNSKGVDTSILFGFTKYLLDLIEREKPTHLAVSFDPPGGTFRNKLYPAYKANRGETPQLVIDALEPLTAIVKAMDIPVLMIPGFEADDVIGSAAIRFASEGFEVYMVTPDKDYGQLVGRNIWQYRPGKGGDGNEILGIPEICAKWGINSTSQVIDILALCGDSSDNVPGVQGVGPVGASKLLMKYGGVDGIYAHIGELTARQQELFKAAEDHIGLSRELVTIKTDIPIDVNGSDLVLDTRVTAELEGLFSLYEFNSLKRRLCELFPEGKDSCCSCQAENNSVPDMPAECDPAAAGHPAILALLLADGVLYVAAEGLVSSGRPEQFRSLLEDASVVKAGCGLKQLIRSLSSEWNIELEGRLLDVELMHYLINPESSHSLDSLAGNYLGIDLEMSGRSGIQASLFDDEPVQGPDYPGRVWASYLLSLKLDAEMKADPRLSALYDGMEEPLLRVLASMEMNGVKVDIPSLNEFAESLRTRVRERESEVRGIAGNPALNLSSPKQVGELIFERLKLDPKAKKPSKGNWPTDEDTLTGLYDRSPVIEAILDYRGLKKLLSTYIEPFPSYVSRSDGRVHTTFNQTLTSTGRLSSSGPNLQNIPVRTEQGREIRKAFVSGMPDSVLLSADYSQIELRIMAHLSGDRHLCEAFREGVDVHSVTASRIYGVDVSEVTPEQRRVAKTANFGIMYGISSFGLSQRLRCSRSEAKKIIDDYFASFPSIRSFIDETLAEARRNSYVETLSGRRRYIPDINSPNGNIRSVAERNAVNAPIQGSSADIIKRAMINVDRCLREEKLKARMVLQIHDELLLEVPLDELERVKETVVREMEGAATLSVPLTVECNYGNNWLEAH